MAEEQERDPAVARLLAALEAALMEAAPEGSPGRGTAMAVLGRCRERVGPPRAPRGAPEAPAPAGAVLRKGLAPKRSEARHEVVGALAALAPRLLWVPKGAPAADGTAPPMNTMLLGPGGVEERDDVWIGATAMEPGTVYPEHSHPPEEVYLPLTPGEWWNEAMDWRDPGEGVIRNPPGIRHAMRAGASPLLAVWLLPL